MNQDRHPRGVATGGQFAATNHAEPEVGLTAEPELSLKDLDWAQSLHGTYDADCADGYYEAMGKVFAAARADLEAKRDQRLEAKAEELSQIVGISTGLVHAAHKAIGAHAPNTPEWEEALQSWSQDILQQPRGAVLYIVSGMTQAAGPE